ncbi:MAG TPA: hypothetical protein VFV75_06365 [Candidatus Polarisedimenticolaceae bacterium]|nr:hypothetical protein [Candidatus Polarisedimenticolaceae bacterium]
MIPTWLTVVSVLSLALHLLTGFATRYPGNGWWMRKGIQEAT